MSSPSSSPVKRKTPVKRDGSTKLLGMTDTELKALCYGSICTSEKIKVDYDKLASMLKITRKSASNQYTAARNRLNKIIMEDTGMDPDDLVTDTPSPAKKTKVTKPKATRAPRNSKKVTKASKAKPEPEAEPDTKGVKDEEDEVADTESALCDGEADYEA